MAQKSAQKKIIILGGSYGGISIAHHVLKHSIPALPEEGSYQVILVSPSSQAMLRQACPRAMISETMFPQDKLFVNIAQLFEQYPGDNFRFVQGTATSLNNQKRTVSIVSQSGSEDIGFYALVIATGSSTSSPLLGLIRDSDFLRSSWNELREALPNIKSIVIAGGGPAGIETAGELGEYLNGRAGWFASRLESPKVAITVVTSGPKILPVLRASIADKAERYLAKLGVTVIKNSRVRSVAPEGAGATNVISKTTVTLSDGKVLDADLYIPAIGTRPNTSFIDEALLMSDGRIDTNPSTLRVDKAGPRIYAIGDASSFAQPAVHQILAAVPVLGANIKRDLLLDVGKAAGEDRVFKEDTRETQMVPIGKSKGVGAAMGYAMPSFFVWLIKGRDYWLWTVGNLWNGKQWAKEA